MARYVQFDGRQVVRMSDAEYRALRRVEDMIDDADQEIPNHLDKGLAALRSCAGGVEDFDAVNLVERIAARLLPVREGKLASRVARTACYREKLRLVLDDASLFIPSEVTA